MRVDSLVWLMLLLIGLHAPAVSAETVQVDPHAEATATGRFERWQPDAGLIVVEGQAYRLTGRALEGFIDTGRLHPHASLRPGDMLVVTLVDESGGSGTRTVRRIERFEPRQ
jgi:hypothetical protein